MGKHFRQGLATTKKLRENAFNANEGGCIVVALLCYSAPGQNVQYMNRAAPWAEGSLMNAAIRSSLEMEPVMSIIGDRT